MGSVISGQRLRELKKNQSTAPVLFPDKSATCSIAM
jgi:hypothetical protein